MGIEPVANSLSPVESVGLTLLEDLIGAQRRRILRPSCAQIYPSPKILGDGIEAEKSPAFGAHRFTIPLCAKSTRNSSCDRVWQLQPEIPDGRFDVFSESFHSVSRRIVGIRARRATSCFTARVDITRLGALFSFKCPLSAQDFEHGN